MTTRVELECGVCDTDYTIEIPGVQLDETEYKNFVTSKGWAFVEKNAKTIGVLCPICAPKLTKELKRRNKRRN